jgi:hypothetical protein
LADLIGAFAINYSGRQNEWLLWLILAVFFLVVELATVNLVSIWFFIGTVAALVVTLCGGGFALQISVMLIVSLISLWVFWRCRDRMKVSPRRVEFTNADRIIGEIALVTHDIDPIRKIGQISVLGQTWSAVSADEHPIAKSTKVKVVGLKGVKAVVETQKNLL